MAGKPKYTLDDEDIDQLAEQLLMELAADHSDELDLILQWLRRASDGAEALKALMKFRHIPVGIREFIESPEFMDRKGIVWPSVIDELEKINDGSRTEAVLTGGIGVAKTTIALYTQAYQLYLMSCLRDPHKEFDLDPATEIVIVFQSLNKQLAGEVDYQRFREMLKDAPYFRQHFPFDQSRESEMRFPKRIRVKPISGQDTGAIGQNVIGGIIDEINFMAVVEKSKMSRDGGVHDQAIKNYNTIARRRESRFMQMGWVPGMLCLVSSRNYPGQFTDKKEEEARTNPRIYVYDKRLWELRPDRFSGEWFRVFVGDATRKPYIMEEGRTVPLDDTPLVMKIPIEYREQFNADLLGSLRDIAGVATQALHPYMLDTDAISACFGRVQSIASRDEVDFIKTRLQLYPKRLVHPDEPRFCHIDLAISRDAAGVSVGHVPKFAHIDRGDETETLPLIQFDMTLRVVPPRAGEIEFERIRRLIYAMRDIGLNIKWVTFDQFQSKDSMQILSQRGFITGYQSLDTDTTAYDVTKQAFYDRRIAAPEHLHAQSEFVRLERDPKTQKIDHPVLGSKDVSDSMAGVVYGLTMRREIWVRHQIPLTRIPQSLINREKQVKGSLSQQEQQEGGRRVRYA